MNDDLELALALADAADEVTMAHYLQDDLQVETKADASPVTEADKACELRLRTLISEHTNDGVLGEEFGEESTTNRCWILDPIDGTKNYLRGVPVWATLIALQVDGTYPVGVVSAPAMGRRWWADPSGAYTQDVSGSYRQIHASNVATIAGASVSISDQPTADPAGRQVSELLNQAWRTRGYGDFWSHLLVAEGAVDIAVEPGLRIWDYAALVPIISQSGGKMTTFSGENVSDGSSVLTTNGHLHDLAVRMLQTAT